MEKAAVRKITTAILFYFYNSFITNVPAYSVRHFFLRRMLRIPIGKNSAIHMGCFFSGRKVIIGSNTVINRNCFIDGRVETKIGNNVSISPEAYIVSLTHDPQSSSFATISKPVSIENYAWIGVRAIILPGVTISKGAIVGAGAVVTKSCGEYEIVAGVPAKKIGIRNENLNYTLRYFPLFNTDVQ